jgi:hypothetical protein
MYVLKIHPTHQIESSSINKDTIILRGRFSTKGDLSSIIFFYLTSSTSLSTVDSERRDHMPTNTLSAKELVLGQPVHAIIEASVLYTQSDLAASEISYYKTLDRLEKSGDVIRLSKGLYYRPKKTRYGTVPIGEEQIINHFISNNRGIMVGYRMYMKNGLTTQISKRVELLSSVVRQQRRNIGHITISKISMELTPSVISTIETFEILQNYHTIEDLNIPALAEYLYSFSKIYTDETAAYILAHRTYKKSTIAFLSHCLTHLGVSNDLGKYLSPLSNYRIPPMEAIFALT